MPVKRGSLQSKVVVPGISAAGINHLREWYARTRRPLPWRADRDPYKVWLSEVMLQQTQVETVITYFQRFITHLPTLADLAAADEATVLKLWEGLGYYRRARGLWRAAQLIVTKHQGIFPTNRSEVLALPGIGRYTAGAILSLAFGQREPILEANTTRLFARLQGFTGDCQAATGQKKLWAFAEAILPQEDCGWFNQALMELGSQVCTPREPACSICPLAEECLARKRCKVQRIPKPKQGKVIEQSTQALVVAYRIKRNGSREVLMTRSGHASRWEGMWDFVRCELKSTTVESATAAQQRKSIESLCVTKTGMPLELLTELPVIKHTVTRFRIHLHCYVAREVRPEPMSGSKSQRARSQVKPPWQWIPLESLTGLPMPITARKVAARLPAVLTHQGSGLNGNPKRE